MKKKKKNVFLRNKIMTLLLLISIVLVIIILVVASKLVFTSSNPYGNRLNGIEKVEVDLDLLKNRMTGDSKVKEAEVYLKGKVIHCIYTTDENDSFNSIIQNMEGVLGLLTEEEKEFYDVQIFIEGKSEKLPIIGYKSRNTESIIWTYM